MNVWECKVFISIGCRYKKRSIKRRHENSPTSAMPSLCQVYSRFTGQSRWYIVRLFIPRRATAAEMAVAMAHEIQPSIQHETQRGKSWVSVLPTRLTRTSCPRAHHSCGNKSVPVLPRTDAPDLGSLRCSRLPRTSSRSSLPRSSSLARTT